MGKIYLFPGRLINFSILIALLYTLSAIGVSYRYPNIDYAYYYIISFSIIFLMLLFKYIMPHSVAVAKPPHFKTFPLSILLFSLFFTFIVVKTSLYGSFDNAFFTSYTSRTGHNSSGIFNVVMFLLVGNTALLLLICYLNWTFYRSFSIFSFLFLISTIFFLIIGGNRNLVLFVISCTLCFWVLSSTTKKIFFGFMSLYILMVLVAWFRNFGFSMLIDGSISFPSLNYFDPSVHEFGTSANVYSIYMSSYNLNYPLHSSYFFIIINLIPNFASSFGVVSFSDYFSIVHANNGEGLGMSPVVEIIYNSGYGLFIQFLPLFIPFFIAVRLLKSNILVSMIFFGVSLIASFNLWRIDFSVVLKIQLLFFLFSYYFYKFFRSLKLL